MTYDTPEWRAERNKRLLEWCCGDREAAGFLVDLSSLIETWDDLIDLDTPVSPERINGAFITALVGFNNNRFFMANHGALIPLLTLAINAWLDSVEMERGEDVHERMWSFFLKDLGRELFIHVAGICGGFNHMRAVSMDMRRFFTHETYETWEHRHAA